MIDSTIDSACLRGTRAYCCVYLDPSHYSSTAVQHYSTTALQQYSSTAVVVSLAVPLAVPLAVIVPVARGHSACENRLMHTWYGIYQRGTRE